MLNLFDWWNAVYLIPLAFVLLVLTITSVISMVGGALESDQDVDVEHDVEVDVDADAEVDVEADVDHDIDADHNGHVSVVEHAAAAARGDLPHGDHGFLVSGLLLLGVGRAPAMMVFQVLILLWGLIGLTLHAAASVAGPLALLWSIPVSFVLSVLGTRGFAQLFGHFFKQVETSAVKREQIVGRVGKVVYPVTEEEGTISVRDLSGTLHRVRARSRHGELDSGREIIVVGYDPQSRIYQVDDASHFVDRP